MSMASIEFVFMNTINLEPIKQLEQMFDLIIKSVEDCELIQVRGRVIQVTGTIIRAIIPGVRVGELCELKNNGYQTPILAEVVGFQDKVALLIPFGEMIGISSTTEVLATGKTHELLVGDHLLGQIINGLGFPVSDFKIPSNATPYSIYRSAPSPMQRKMIRSPMALGIKAIDGLLTCGEGQRLGIFAAAGVGKSTLLSQIIKNAQADVIVLALIGERGREVREFIEKDLGSEGMKRAVVVASTSDRPAMERAKAAHVATTVAEYFRDQGKNVLLLMDSVTRFARAQREIGLAAGEPATRRGYPPSVFVELPKLLERAGQSSKGSITALYTVLVEGDDMTEPVADETRAILDGHIVLSRKLAAENHYPAIDILNSTSRVMNQIIDNEQVHYAGILRKLVAKYKDVELLVKIGEYQSGSDELADMAIAKKDLINEFLTQYDHEFSSFEEAKRLLIEACR